MRYILAGNWSLGVVDQRIENFEINFTMVHPDGSDWHYHEISNFEPDFGIPILLDPGGQLLLGCPTLEKTTWISGLAYRPRWSFQILIQSRYF